MYNSLKPSNIREENMKQIIKLLRTSDQLLSRADIARRVSLSAPSVSKIITILLEAGILTEREEGSSGVTGGRKPILLDINENCSYLIGIYIEEKILTITLANFSGQIVNTSTYSYEIRSDFECIDFLIRKMKEVLNKNSVEIDRLLSIGVSVPGVFDSSEGVIKFAPNIELWEERPIESELVREFDCEVIIDNAVNMAVLGERWQGSLKDCENAIYIKLARGIGAGILINNQLYRGNNNIAGEIGYMVSELDLIDNKRDNYGTLESFCSTKFITEEAKEILPGTIEDFQDIIDIIKTGETELDELFQNVCQQVAVAIANVVCVLNPEKIVIGGDLSTIIRCYKSEINNIISRVVPVSPELIFSTLGKKVFYLGAIVRGLENIEEKLIKNYLQEV